MQLRQQGRIRVTGSQSEWPSESLILAPWSKVDEWRAHPPPHRRQLGAPEVFIPGAPSGRHCLCLKLGAPYSSYWVIFFFLFSFPSFFLSNSSPFLSFSFLAPLSRPGGPRPQSPPPPIRPWPGTRTSGKFGLVCLFVHLLGCLFVGLFICLFRFRPRFMVQDHIKKQYQRRTTTCIFKDNCRWIQLST